MIEPIDTELKYFLPKKLLLRSQKYALVRSKVLKNLSQIPDPGIKKHWILNPGSATLHDHTQISYLAGAADDRILGGAEQGVTLGIFGTLVDQAGVNTVGGVPEVGVLGQVVPGIAVPAHKKWLSSGSFYNKFDHTFPGIVAKYIVFLYSLS